MRNLGVLVAAFFVFFAVSCSDGSDGGISAPVMPQDTVPQDAAFYAYSADSPTFDVADSIKTVTVSGVKGKNLYLAKYNLDNGFTFPSEIRVLSSATGLKSVQDNFYGRAAIGDGGVRAGLTPKDFTDDVEQIQPVAGTTTKDLYIPWYGPDGFPKSFFRMTFVARAVGEHCIVWAPAEVQSAEAQGDHLNPPSGLSFPDKTAGNSVFTDEMANELRDKFELAYPYMTAMFGDKAQKIFATHRNSDKTQVGIRKVSDTAAYTNIVVYDFAKSSNAEWYGIFWDMDYHPSFRTLYGTEWDKTELASEGDYFGNYYSNEGNYIYITVDEVVFGEKRLAKKAWVEENEHSGTLVCYPNSYLAVCHEYTHSLQFARKVIEQNLTSSPMGLDEMLAMLCEDVMQNVLGVPKNYTVENYRIGEFCNKHYYSSIMDRDSNLSYANLLVFGIYLTRNYGGARLVGDMVTNDDNGGWSCILKAIKNVAGVEKTTEQLMKEFLEQLLVADSRYTSNRNPAPLTVNGVELTMPAVNTRNFSDWFGYELATMKPGDEGYAELQQVTKGVKTYDAKDIIREKSVVGRGYIPSDGGFNLHFIGTAGEDTVSLVFSSAEEAYHPPKMMIIVGE